MSLEDLNDIVAEVSHSMNYVIVIIILQISLIFLYQWYSRRKERLQNKIILGYSLYFLFFAIGMFITFDVTTHPTPSPIFDSLFLLSLIIRGIGGISFTMILEYSIQKTQKTWYLLTIGLTFLILLIPILYNSPIFAYLVNLFNLSLLILPTVFTIYFIINTYGAIRRRLIIALCGFLIFCTTLYINSPTISEAISSILIYPAFILFISQFLTVCSCNIIIYGFYGYAFFLEHQWKENLISLIIINKMTTKNIYSHDFQETTGQDVDLLGGGITGIEQVIKEFTDKNANIEVINLEKVIILLAHGEKIITALVIKKIVPNAQYFLKEITSKVELYFGDYLQYSESSKSTISEPIRKIIYDIIKL